jgi:hypothetical protein
MSKPKVFVLGHFHPDAIAVLKESKDVDLVLPDDPRSHQWHNEADGILIRSEIRITEKDFSMAKKLKVVVKQGELTFAPVKSTTLTCYFQRNWSRQHPRRVGSKKRRSSL